MRRLCDRLGVAEPRGHEGSTTADGEYTVRFTECIAACDKAPAVQVNFRYFGPVTPERADEFLEHMERFSLETPLPSSDAATAHSSGGRLSVPSSEGVC
jgi:NADH-quinone oxidoreductase subunit E